MNAIEVAEKAQDVARHIPTGRVEIVGRWIWIDFPARPAYEVREYLKSEKFRWNRKRAVWQFAGIPSRHSRAGRSWIEAKYGTVSIEAE